MILSTVEVVPFTYLNYRQPFSQRILTPVNVSGFRQIDFLNYSSLVPIDWMDKFKFKKYQKQYISIPLVINFEVELQCGRFKFDKLILI